MKAHRLQLLDSSRGIAALFVVLFHITGEMWYKFNHYVFLGGFFNFGNVGVDFFFVLSGFIIFSIHNKDRSTGQSILTFFKKRLIRIYPSYWIIVSIVLLTYIFLQSFIVDKPNLTSFYLIASYTLFPHLHRLIFPSWTLTQEVYFYLFFGLLILIPQIKVRLGIFFIISVVLFVFSFFINHAVVNNISALMQQAFISPFMLEFAGGCIVGYIFSYMKREIRIIPFLFVSIISLALLLIALYIQTTGLYIPLITISFSLFIWALASLEVSHTFTVSVWVLLIGDASYLIYLSHIFIFKVIEKLTYYIFKTPSNEIILFSICILGFAACVTLPIGFHLIFEKPMLRFLRAKLL